MSSTSPTTEQKGFLRNVSWETLQALLLDLGDHRASRLAYDDGVLEIMSPSQEHERIASLIGLLIQALGEELDIDIRGTGSTTLQRRDKKRAVEPDRSFYIASEAAIRSKKQLEYTMDPLPDLAVEVDITRKSIDRFPIYGALGVREVWRHEGETVKVYVLQREGEYEESERSAAFPMLPIAELVRFLNMRDELSDTRLVKAFRAWVRTQLKRD